MWLPFLLVVVFFGCVAEGALRQTRQTKRDSHEGDDNESERKAGKQDEGKKGKEVMEGEDGVVIVCEIAERDRRAGGGGR